MYGYVVSSPSEVHHHDLVHHVGGFTPYYTRYTTKSILVRGSRLDRKEYEMNSVLGAIWAQILVPSNLSPSDAPSFGAPL